MLVEKFLHSFRTTGHKRVNGRRGFTLVEVLVALFIFSAVSVIFFQVASSSISHSIYARNKVTAFYLAQEAMEYLNNERDLSILRNPDPGDDWWVESDVVNNCVDFGECNINPFGLHNDDENEVCEINGQGSSVCATLVDSDGVYKPKEIVTGGDDSGFERRIEITETEGEVDTDRFTGNISKEKISDKRLDITVTVSWSEAGGAEKKVELSREMTPWNL